MYLEFIQEAKDDKERFIQDKNIKDGAFNEWVKRGLEKSFNLTKEGEESIIKETSESV